METKRTKNVTILEIGADTVKLAIGSAVNENPILYAVAERDCRGCIANGQIVDSERLRAIIAGLADFGDDELRAKTSIQDVYLILPPNGLKIYQSNAETAVVSPNSVIDNVDIRNIHNALWRRGTVPQGQKVIDIVPDFFAIDGGRLFANPPLYEHSDRLSVQAKIHAIPAEIYSAYRSVVEQAGFHIMGNEVAPYCASLLIGAQEKDTPSYILVDIGARNTTLSLVGNNNFFASVSIPRGDAFLTDMIAEQLNITTKQAETIKRVYGYDQREREYKVPLITIESGDARPVQYFQEHLNSIIASFYEEFNRYLSGALEQLLAPSLQASNVNNQQFILTLPALLIGGGSKLFGIEKLIAPGLGAHEPRRFMPKVAGARDPRYVSLVGLIISSCTQRGALTESTSSGVGNLSRDH